MKAFRAQWPAVTLSLDTDIEHHAVEALLRDELDLVLTTDVRHEQQVSFQPLFSLELKAYLYPEHPLAQQAVILPQDLAGCDLLSYPIPLERQDLFRFFLKKNQFHGRQRQVGTSQSDFAISGGR